MSKQSRDSSPAETPRGAGGGGSPNNANSPRAPQQPHSPQGPQGPKRISHFDPNNEKHQEVRKTLKEYQNGSAKKPGLSVKDGINYAAVEDYVNSKTGVGTPQKAIDMNNESAGRTTGIQVINRAKQAYDNAQRNHYQSIYQRENLNRSNPNYDISSTKGRETRVSTILDGRLTVDFRSGKSLIKDKGSRRTLGGGGYQNTETGTITNPDGTSSMYQGQGNQNSVNSALTNRKSNVISHNTGGGLFRQSRYGTYGLSSLAVLAGQMNFGGPANEYGSTFGDEQQLKNLEREYEFRKSRVGQDKDRVKNYYSYINDNHRNSINSFHNTSRGDSRDDSDEDDLDSDDGDIDTSKMMGDKRLRGKSAMKKKGLNVAKAIKTAKFTSAPDSVSGISPRESLDSDVGGAHKSAKYKDNLSASTANLLGITESKYLYDASTGSTKLNMMTVEDRFARLIPKQYQEEDILQEIYHSDGTLSKVVKKRVLIEKENQHLLKAMKSQSQAVRHMTIEEIMDFFTQDQIEELADCFSIFDFDGSGAIGSDELCTIMKALGKNSSLSEIEQLIRDVDLDGSGEIEFPEFLLIMCQKLSRADTESELRDCFRLLDRDGNGQVTASELKSVMLSMGEHVSLAEVQEMIAEADPGGDGELDTDDFLGFVKERGLMNLV